MEQLLFVLFILFSIGSAIMERRKRKKQLEEAQKRADERRRRQREAGDDEEVSRPVPVAIDDDDDDEEDWGGWPFPGGGDPFERPQPQVQPTRRSASAPMAEEDESAPVVTDVRSLLEQIESRSRHAEDRAQAEEERAMERARQAREAVTSQPQRTVELVQKKLRQSMPMPSNRPARRRAQGNPWRMTPDTARKAVVYAEIFGSCKAEAGENERWS